MTTALAPERTALLRRRIRIVVAITIAWNVVEAIIALIAGGIASSAALVGFGLDSIVEVLSAAAVRPSGPSAAKPSTKPRQCGRTRPSAPSISS